MDVDSITLDDGHGFSVGILTYGGRIQSIEVPDRSGRIANVALGFDDPSAYLENNPYFGAIVGRYANRIAGGRFAIDGSTYQVSLNEANTSLHGGVHGFDARVWDATIVQNGPGPGVVLRRTSEAGEEGYPGRLSVEVSYRITGIGELRVTYRARLDHDETDSTIVNPTNHSYFNLSGQDGGSIHDHVLQIHASRYTPIDHNLIPTGSIDDVAGTPFDFTHPTPISKLLSDTHDQLVLGKGYDHNWVLNRSRSGLRHAATVWDPASGRSLEIMTTEPGLQFYSGGQLDGSIVGSGGQRYGQGAGLALETQHFPDSPNNPNFPTTVLRPGSAFLSETVMRFSSHSGARGPFGRPSGVG